MDAKPYSTGSWMDPRRFLAGVAGVAGAAAIAQVPVGRAVATPRPAGGEYPFQLGVASGDPTPTGVVLWTRLAPLPFVPGGGMPARAVPVEWQVARDERFRHVVRDGTSWALPELAHSVHVQVDGLRPDGEWFYRFRYRQDVSAIGRTRTTPHAGSGGTLAFAFAPCQAWDSGFYPSYRHMAREDLDLVLHLGDYVYEGGSAPTAATGRRRHPKCCAKRHATSSGGACSTRCTRATLTGRPRTPASHGWSCGMTTRCKRLRKHAVPLRG